MVVTDAAAGVELDQIKFHVDVDRDEIFDEPGEIITASAAESTKINQGWNAVALLPAISPDGLVNWYVTATDRASNVRQSDSEATAGDQFHITRSTRHRRAWSNLCSVERTTKPPKL